MDLHDGVADASSLFAEHLVLQRLVNDNVGYLLQVNWTWLWKKQKHIHKKIDWRYRELLKMFATSDDTEICTHLLS